MKYLWVFVVMSASAFGQNAFGPDFMNLHCTAPDPLAQTLFNIPPRPGLVPDRSANGNIVVYCDSSMGTLKASFSGGQYIALGGQTVLNVQSFGVTGNGTTDDTTAFQNAINAACGSTLGLTPGAMLVIPKLFNVRISSTINVNQCGGLVLDGQSATGQAGFSAIITWAGGNGGTVFAINRTRDSIFRNFSIQALNSSNIYNIGFDIDENSGSGITSHNLYQNLLVGGLPGGTQNTNFVGIRIGQNAPGNTEQQVFQDIVVGCGGGTLTDTSNGIGIQVNKVAGAAQPFYIPILRAEILGCSHGVEVNANARDVIVDGGNYGPNFHSLYLRGGDGVTFENITTTLDASSTIFFNGFSGQFWAHNDQFTGGGANVIDVTNASGGAKIDIEQNNFGGVGMLTGTFTPGSPTGFLNIIGNNNFVGCPTQSTTTFGMLLYNIPTSGTCDNVFISKQGVVLASSTFANLPAASNGTLMYCSDCKNVTDDTTGTFDSAAASGGHGTNVLRENAAWRVH